MKILIDNGHGRETAGRRSPDGRLLEWAYTHEIARRVNTELQRRGFFSSLTYRLWLFPLGRKAPAILMDCRGCP